MSIQEIFDRSSKTYDHERRRLIPCYDDFYTIPLDIIPFHQDRELRVLDLGAGTGLLSAGVAARYPRALLTLVDLSPAMLRIAEERFAGSDAGRVTFQVMDYGKEPLRGIYDLIISALSIHHLTDNAKADLFEKVHNALEPGGMFINADLVQGENAMAEKICVRTWLRKVRENGISEEALTAAFERMKEDRMSPLSSQLAWLTQANFIDVTTWYRNYSFVIYSATKPLTAK
ncbi:MAG: class I SAM-dependent methyltransferase [Proteobacteria bacterium]|nr:class I SAM-dependent methyltransferase [Pseudomonadota bacterium]